MNKQSFNNKATAKMLYGIAELEALHFSSMDSALIYIDKLINLKNNKHKFDSQI